MHTASHWLLWSKYCAFCIWSCVPIMVMICSSDHSKGLSILTKLLTHNVFVWFTFVNNRSSQIFGNSYTCVVIISPQRSPYEPQPPASVQFSHSVVSDSLWPHELQHTRPPCPSPTPGVHSDSHTLSQWCHPAISISVILFSSCPQSLPASESFPMSQLFTWGGQSTGVSALAPFLPKKSQGWSPSEWTGWISLQSKWLSVPKKAMPKNTQITAQPHSSHMLVK